MTPAMHGWKCFSRSVVMTQNTRKHEQNEKNTVTGRRRCRSTMGVPASWLFTDGRKRSLFLSHHFVHH